MQCVAAVLEKVGQGLALGHVASAQRCCCACTTGHGGLAPVHVLGASHAAQCQRSDGSLPTEPADAGGEGAGLAALPGCCAAAVTIGMLPLSLQVLEETGLDITSGLREPDFIDVQLGDQDTRLFIVQVRGAGVAWGHRGGKCRCRCGCTVQQGAGAALLHLVLSRGLA